MPGNEQQSVPECTPYRPRPGRACTKIFVLLCAAVILFLTLAYCIDKETVDTLKQSLSVGTIVALVVVINLISFIVFMVMYAAWQWVRCDLKAPRPENHLD
ncbi:MAG: hypothetical protein H6853_01690 [Rhodospirillales bacterium]|nr:hypothetical protein [Alphaproteobacteria bacterium]USO04016.1 MAG: hypothetical protein H6853_01690 [Rhodospirillales bacterium]